MTASSLDCDGWCDRTGEVTHIDNKGYAYCTPCGMRRRWTHPCRKLRPHELNKLKRGERLERY